MRKVTWGVLALSLATAAACGGKAVIDGTAGSGGGGGVGGQAGAEGGHGARCADLGERLRTGNDLAMTCNPSDPGTCTGQLNLHDECGCTLVGSDSQYAAVQDALDTYFAWVAEGCGPQLCNTPCPPAPPGAPWTCSSASGRCAPLEGQPL